MILFPWLPHPVPIAAPLSAFDIILARFPILMSLNKLSSPAPVPDPIPAPPTPACTLTVALSIKISLTRLLPSHQRPLPIPAPKPDWISRYAPPLTMISLSLALEALPMPVPPSSDVLLSPSKTVGSVHLMAPPSIMISFILLPTAAPMAQPTEVGHVPIVATFTKA